MKDSEVGAFIVMAISALSAYATGAIDKLDALLFIISMTLIYILLVLYRIKSNLEKRK